MARYKLCLVVDEQTHNVLVALGDELFYFALPLARLEITVTCFPWLVIEIPSSQSFLLPSRDFVCRV